MTLAYTYDGSAFTYAVAPTSLKLASGADGGASVFCGLTPEDPTAALAMKGHRPFVVTESACSQPRLFTGWTTERGIGRSYEAGQFVGASARAHDVTIVDLNALFGFRLISGADGNRPSETFAQRIAWILGSDYLDGLVSDTGYIASSEASYTVDAADYRDGYPAAVLNDLMDRTAGWYNYFAFWDPVAAAVGLWIGQLDDAVSDSTLRVSNVAADVDGSTTFAPDASSEVTVSPTDTYSEVVVRYAHGTQRLFRSRTSTATNYIRRGTTIDRPYTGAAATASAQAERYLDQHANEQDRITVTIIVPAAAAGLAVAGQRMDVKFSHLTGYTAFTSMRIVNTSLTPTNDHATHYALTLELAAPRPAGPGSGSSTLALVQAATGGNSGLPPAVVTLPAPVTAGNLIVLICGAHGTTTAAADIAGYTKINYGSDAFTGIYLGSSYRITVFAKIATGGEQSWISAVHNSSIVTAAEFSGIGDSIEALQIEGVPFQATTIATYPAITPSLPGSAAVLIRADYKDPSDPNPGPMTLTGWGLLGDSGFASSGPGYRMTDFYLLDTAADASYASASRSSSGTYPEERGIAVTIAVLGSPVDTEISLPTPPAVTAIIDQINNLEYLGDIPLGLPEL